MEKFLINDEKGRELAEIDSYLNSFNNKNKEEIINNIIKDFNEGYSIYEKKENLRKSIEFACFNFEDKEENKFSFEINEKKKNSIKKIFEDTFRMLQNFISQKIKVLLLPCLNNFIIKNMGGCFGFCPNDFTIVISLNFPENWQKSLAETIGHETAHAISPYYKGGDYTLGEGFVFDGLAEHFRESTIGNGKSKWSNAITKEKAMEIIKELKNKFYIKDRRLWREVFFGNGAYPHWTGYSIGYYLVEDYLKKQEKINWKKIIATPPINIFKEMLQEWNIN